MELHYLSPLSVGLFKRGILQSGSPTVSRLFYERDPTVSDVKNRIPKLALETGCIESETDYLETPLEQIYNCLREAPGDRLTRPEDNLIRELSLSFGPSVGDEFLPDLSSFPWLSTTAASPLSRECLAGTSSSLLCGREAKGGLPYSGGNSFRLREGAAVCLPATRVWTESLGPSH